MRDPYITSLDEYTYNTYYIPFMEKIKSVYDLTQDEYDLIERKLVHYYHIFGSKLDQIEYDESFNIHLMDVIIPYRRNKNLNSLL